MSYWYNRVTKSGVIMMIVAIPLVLVSNSCGMLGSYAGGCVATASRTMYDWVFVSHSMVSIELIPNVQMALEAGCVDWLGFSTCEPVQFTDWVNIFHRDEVLTVTMFNVTSTPAFSTTDNRLKVDAITLTELAPMTLSRKYVDTGSISAPFNPAMLLMHRVENSVAATVPDVKVMVPKLPSLSTGAIPSRTGFGTMTTTKALLNMAGPGIKAPPFGGYLKNYIAETITLRSSQVEGWAALMKITDFSPMSKCAIDKDCGMACAWNSICTPQPLGFSGVIFPSAKFFKGWQMAFYFAEWPLINWKFYFYCPENDEDKQCQKALPLVVFDPMLKINLVYTNQGPTKTLESWPNSPTWMWKPSTYLLRKELCDGNPTLGSAGRDCDSPSGFMNYDFAGPVTSGSSFLYVSYPFQASSDVKYATITRSSTATGGTPTIYSCRVTGTRLHFYDEWQVTMKLTQTTVAATGTTPATKVTTYFPLYWASRTPVKKEESLKETNMVTRFDNLGDYPNYIVSINMTLYALKVVTFVILLYLFLRGITCLAFLEANERKYDAERPEWF